ncbi:ankyrin repeat-containing domain protein [Xylaria telfairii]|nr:ankyrin repeat-containing domain protein [Xylaria telfairii]
MNGADIFQAVASAVSIVDCSVRLAKFIHQLKNDVRDIHDWLVEIQASIDTLRKILEFVKTVAKRLDIKHADDGPTEWICSIVRSCEERAAKICEKLSLVPEDGLLPRIKFVLRKLMNDHAIKEHQRAIQEGTSLLQTILGALSLERASHLPAPYELHKYHNDEFARINFKFEERLSDKLSFTGASSCYGSNDAASVQTDTQAYLPILYKVKQERLQQYQSKVVELELKGQYLEAAMEQRSYIKLRRELKNHTPLNAQDEALLVERQANLLLQCPTIGRHREAATLLESFINNKERTLSEEVNGRIKLKIGELYLAEGRFGRTDKVEHAKSFLNEAVTLLENQDPFPHELYPRSVERLVRTLEILQERKNAEALKLLVERRLLGDSNIGLDCEINWEYTDEPECKALAWCRTTNPAFAVESSAFRFDSISQGTSAIHLAVRHEQIEVLREMLVEVEQIDALDSDECTPLLVAAEQRHSDIFELLLDYKASIDKVDRLGQTVLHKCQTDLRHGRDISIASLVHNRKPTLMNATESNGKTALWIACENSNKKMVEFLLSHDADPNIPSTKNNRTPLQVAVDMRSSEGSQKRADDRLRIIKLLLKHGADSNQTDILGNTPLHTAASNGDLAVVQLLLDPIYKTWVDLPGRHGQTPVAVAAQHRRISVITELVSRGASVTSKGAGGNGKSAEDWAKGDHNKALRDALRAADSRRTSESSVGTIWQTTSSTSSGSAQTRDLGILSSLSRVFQSSG